MTDDHAAASAVILPPEARDPVGYILDMANEILMRAKDPRAAAKRRSRAMDAALDAGLRPCEICGRAIKSDKARIVDHDGAYIGDVGPDCAKKIRAILGHRSWSR